MLHAILCMCYVIYMYTYMPMHFLRSRQTQLNYFEAKQDAIQLSKRPTESFSYNMCYNILEWIIYMLLHMYVYVQILYIFTIFVNISYNIYTYFFFLESFFIIIIFYFQTRGREGEREGEKHQCVVASCTPPTGGATWPATQACALIGNQTGDPLVHRPVLNPLSHASQGYTDFYTVCLYPGYHRSTKQILLVKGKLTKK